ncbi:PTS sugar transporter subunit IIA [bacterium]|jgi:mannitol/fructose-specific phosphotransferase system IIA component (Ntr-type)/Kef-type K+ transport system membrane component KefB|nr:PTS sugar transporter subunit IIA [bacterium]
MRFEVFYMQILSLGLLVLAAHFGGKITKKIKIGEVVGQVVGGLVVGPVLLFCIESKVPAYKEAILSLHFFTFVFLSIIAFGIGDELSISKLKKVGNDVLIICIIQALSTWVLITGVFFFLGFKYPQFTPNTALIIGSIGIATAPAVTFVIMNKLGIAGSMRNMLGGIVVLDDVIEIVIFSVICQVTLLSNSHSLIRFGEVFIPVAKDIGLAVLLGFGVFCVLRLMVERKWLKTQGNNSPESYLPGSEFLSRLISEMPGPSVEIFIIVAGCVSLGVGLALHWHLPFLITAVAAGVFIANLYSTEVFKSLRIENATSMYTLVFFALIGANAKIESFHPENFIFIGAYILARGTGKIGGTWLGCKLTHQEKRIASCLPRLMLPQAGVAAVEAYFVATVLGKEGETVLSIILPGLIIFEIFGVIISERALLKWRSWVTGGGEFLSEEEVIRKKMGESVKLSDLIVPECVKVPFKAKYRGEIIWGLIDMLKKAGYIDNSGEVLDFILERERQGGITLGEGIAILHGRIPDIKTPGIAFGILPKGGELVFGGAGGDVISIVFMVVSPDKTPEIHLQVLAAIAKLLTDQEARTRLKYAKDESEAIQIINENS